MNKKIDVNKTIGNILTIFGDVEKKLNEVYNNFQMLSETPEFLELTDIMELLEQCKRIKNSISESCTSEMYCLEVLQRFIIKKDATEKMKIMGLSSNEQTGNEIINEAIENANEHVINNINDVLDDGKDEEGEKK